jgi:phage portal protein BeeE
VNWVKRAIATRLDGIEDRSLAPPSVDPHLPLLTGAPVQDVSTSNALRISDAFACIRALADSVASLPLHAYRRTSAGRVPAGGDSRIVRLLSRPAPGSTIADLMSLVMVHLNVYGEAFVGKYRGADGEIVQLGLIDPTTVDVELDGQRVIYRLMSAGVEVGPSDVLHIKGMSSDGLRGLSPVTACRLALQLSSSLQTAAAALSANDGRPSGILTVPGPSSDAVVEDVRERWDQRHGGPPDRGCRRQRRLHAGQLQRQRRPVPPAARAERARGRADLPRAGLADRRADRRLADLLERAGAEPGVRLTLVAAMVGQAGARDQRRPGPVSRRHVR